MIVALGARRCQKALALNPKTPNPHKRLFSVTCEVTWRWPKGEFYVMSWLDPLWRFPFFWPVTVHITILLSFQVTVCSTIQSQFSRFYVKSMIFKGSNQLALNPESSSWVFETTVKWRDRVMARRSADSRHRLCLETRSPGGPPGPVRPIFLLPWPLLTLLDSSFPRNSVWTWEFHLFLLRWCSSQTLWNPQC